MALRSQTLIGIGRLLMVSWKPNDMVSVHQTHGAVHAVCMDDHISNEGTYSDFFERVFDGKEKMRAETVIDAIIDKVGQKL